MKISELHPHFVVMNDIKSKNKTSRAFHSSQHVSTSMKKIIDLSMQTLNMTIKRTLQITLDLSYCFLIWLTSVCFTRGFHANEKGTLCLLLNTDLLNRSVCPSSLKLASHSPLFLVVKCSLGLCAHPLNQWFKKKDFSSFCEK